MLWCEAQVGDVVVGRSGDGIRSSSDFHFSNQGFGTRFSNVCWILARNWHGENENLSSFSELYGIYVKIKRFRLLTLCEVLGCEVGEPTDKVHDDFKVEKF